MRQETTTKNEEILSEELCDTLDLIMDMQFAVQAAMKEKGVNQKQLAKLTNCSPSNISQMLADGANPRISTIANALNVLEEKYGFASETLQGELFVDHLLNDVGMLKKIDGQKDLYTELNSDIMLWCSYLQSETKPNLMQNIQNNSSNDNLWIFKDHNRKEYSKESVYR